MTTFSWTDPTTNTDGSPITAGEIQGYQLGIRPASGTAGTYPILAPPVASSAVNETLAATGELLAPGDYFAAVRAITATVDSAFSNEGAFNVPVPPPPVPNPPVNFSVA
jgi:hypothetical protein